MRFSRNKAVIQAMRLLDGVVFRIPPYEHFKVSTGISRIENALKIVDTRFLPEIRVKSQQNMP
jgi:hypothetical protein